MAYISTDDVKKIRNALKTEMPQYKFSVVRDHYSSVSIAMMKGPAFAEFEYFDRYAGAVSYTHLTLPTMWYV